MKNNLRKEEPLPDDMSWEDMAGGIDKKMSDLKAKDIQSKKSNDYKWPILLLLLIAGIGGCFLTNLYNRADGNILRSESSESEIAASDINSNPLASEEASAGENGLTNKNIESPVGSSTTIGLSKNENTTQKQSISTQSNAVLGGPINQDYKEAIVSTEYQLQLEGLNNTNGSRQSDSPINDITNAGSDITGNSRSDADSNSQEGITISNSASADEIVQSESFSNADKVDFVLEDRDIAIPFSTFLNPLASLPLQALDIEFNIPVNKEVIGIYDTPIELDLGNRWALTLGAGSNIIGNGYAAASQGKAVAQLESIVPGYSLKGGLELKLSNHLILSTGLQWCKYYRKFEAQIMSQRSIVVPDQIVEIRTSVLTGLVSQKRAAAAININQLRTIVHYNWINQIGAPLSIRYTNTLGRLNYFVGTGVQFSMISGAGKTLRGEEVLLYDSSNSIYKNFGIAAQLELGLRYKLSDRYFIGLESTYSKGLNNWSSEEQETFKPSLYGGQFTIGYRF